MSASKRVLIVGSYAPSLVRFRGPLIAAMVAHGHQVVAAAPGLAEATSEAIRALGAEPREVRIANSSLNPFGMLLGFRQFRSLLRERRPDVLITYTIQPVILGALAGSAERIARIVSMITGAGYAFTGGREPKRMLSRIAASRLYRLALPRSHAVIFQNADDEALFRRLRLLGPGQDVRQVNGSGVDLDYFKPAPQPPAASFLMIARLLKDKGIREFAEAAKRLKASHPKIAIRLVGYLDPSPDSLGQAELEELVHCGIDFLGRLEDVRPAIAESSVYVLPSYREGTPRSVLEAMAMGRAIITTDAPGCRETVSDGANGYLVPPRDADALHSAMLRFVDDPELAPRMGAESRRIAESRYDVHRVNADLLDIAGL